MTQFEGNDQPKRPEYEEGQGLGPLHGVDEGVGAGPVGDGGAMPPMDEGPGEGSGPGDGGGGAGTGGRREPTEKLDSRVVAYWLVAGVLSLIVPFAMVGGGTIWVSTSWPQHSTWVIALASVFGAFLLGVAVISPPMAFNRWRFLVDTELMLARYGIIWIEEKSIPISRLQHVDLQRGPIERLFGLTTLVVFTAGTEGAHFRLPGLAHFRAQQLRDQILAARGDDVI